MVSAARRGFTLMEAIVAMTLSSVLVILVGTTFLVQNNFHAAQLARTAAQDNARMVTEVVASEIRSVMEGGVRVAANRRLVVRSPVVLGAVCAQMPGNRVAVQFDGGAAAMDTDEMSGVALLDPGSGEWDYEDARWNSVSQSGGTAAAACFANGADTLGVSSQFHIFRRFNSLFGSLPPVGSVVMFYREVEYEFDTSEMDPSTMALFRKVDGEDPVEFVTGLDATAQFLYRTGGTTYETSVSGGSRDDIDAIRIEAQARRSPQAGGVDDVTFGWGVNVFLRNRG